MNSEHTTSLRFLGAVGEVTPSSTILHHRFQRQTLDIMVDAGISPGQQERLFIPTGIDYLLLSHGHVDHVGELPQFFIQNPGSKIFVPKGNREIIAHNVTESHRLSQEENPEAKIGRWLNQAQALLNELQSYMPKRGVKRGMRGNRTETTYEHRQRKREMTERENSLESSIYQLIIHLGLSENEIDNMPDNHLVGFFRKRIQDVYDAKLDSLRKKGVVTRSDVTRSLNAIKELTIGTCHKIVSMGQRDIRVRFDPTGHLVTGPACSIGIELPIPGSKRNILFSGDQGNPKLGYPGTNPDYTDLYNKYDTIIMESTYGGSLHPDRANELRKLDAKVSRAIRSKKDIIVVSLALERPVYILYEILQCLKNNGIKPNEVDISYFGESIATLFHYFPKGEIRDMVKPFLKPLIPAATPTPQKNAIMSKLGKRGEKPRIIIASCGFFHPEGPSSRLLEKMYPQSELLIISPNFHGERGSNGYNLFRGHPYQMGLETFEPKPGHDLFSARCFSGHGDREHLVRYARKTARDGKNAGKGGKVFLNHGSERSRLDLAAALESDPVIQSKKVEVVLPKIGRTYKANR